ncbi:hypothetical protein H2136_23665 [Aeromonas hydrophila]|uniref:Uncharacterized protein n=1 Tax=Aeromonas hydrophila TaxID=644 RepID=A0A926IZ86_AERHY|nr:hypothetical protein [Aeromonas hydrophila]
MRFIDITAEKSQEKRNISDEDIDLPPLISTNPYLVGKILDDAGCHCHRHHRTLFTDMPQLCKHGDGRHGLIRWYKTLV